MPAGRICSAAVTMFQRKPPSRFVQLELFPATEPPATEPAAATSPAARHAAASEEMSERLLRRQPPADPPKPAPPARGAERLLEVLAHHLGAGLASLVLTDNRSRIISSRPESDGSLHLRVHRCFAEAPPEVVAALVSFLKSPRRQKRAEALLTIRLFFDRWRSQAAAPATARRIRLEPRGEFFDLAAIRDEVNRQYFGGRLEVAITWGRFGAAAAGGRKKKRGFSVRLGSYHERENLVRIHPVLDRADVPFHVVESIVHHEMVHAVVPTERGKSRRIVHSAEFRRLERLYRHHTEAEAWLKANIERLAKQR